MSISKIQNINIQHSSFKMQLSNISNFKIPISNLHHPDSNIQHPTLTFKFPISNFNIQILQPQHSKFQYPTSNLTSNSNHKLQTQFKTPNPPPFQITSKFQNNFKLSISKFQNLKTLKLQTSNLCSKSTNQNSNIPSKF